MENPVATVQRWARDEGQPGLPNPRICLPRELYGGGRANSEGPDLSSGERLRALWAGLQASTRIAWAAAPLLAEGAPGLGQAPAPVANPADHRDIVGQVVAASARQLEFALAAAAAAVPSWQATPVGERADCLERAGDLLQAQLPILMGLLVREAGKTCASAAAEVREAVDFLRFYAAQIRHWRGADYQALGPVACISPWNFPLAIFTGQVAAALAAGNTVLAKPAEQTPLVAAAAVRALWHAGVPRAVLQLLPGAGEIVGARLVADARVQGVLFTGSTEVARLLQRVLAQRLGRHGQPVALVAETGGQNAMIVDSSALAEQVVADVLASAFDSAGQRCSALRVLCVQEEAASRLLPMLQGALRELRVGNPAQLRTDVGPVIDAEARAGIERHIEHLRAGGRKIRQGRCAAPCGTFVPPTMIEIERLAELKREVFGPVLHVLRYRREDLSQLLDEINATGYALTMGLQTRIDATMAQVAGAARAGNLYVNRNIVGAVVGVQPFGGQGLSGTGPKAGGPLYLLRLLAAMPACAMADALAPFGLHRQPGAPGAALASLRAWAERRGEAALAARCRAFAAGTGQGFAAELPGPTGERNLYELGGRPRIACVATTGEALLVQLAAVLAVNACAIVPAGAIDASWMARLPGEVASRIEPATGTLEAVLAQAPFDALIVEAQGPVGWISRQLADRPGAIVPVIVQTEDGDLPLQRLLVERAISINTAAAGGNTSLMAQVDA